MELYSEACVLSEAFYAATQNRRAVKKRFSAKLTFAIRKIHTFYWHGRKRRARAGARYGSGWSEVGASILGVRRFLLDLWCMGLHGSRKPSRRPEGLGSPRRSRTSHFAGL